MGGAPLRTNSYTWLNGDVRTQSDPRGLTVTNSFDGLHRLTRIDYPDTTYTQYSYSTGGGTMLLDLTGVRDRLGYCAYSGYDAVRRKTFVATETNSDTA